MGDDGAGVYLVRELRKNIKKLGNKTGKEKILDEINFIEAGTTPINFIGEISQSKKIIAVDALKGGEKPGTVYRLKSEEIIENTLYINNHECLHGCSLLEVIKITQFMTDLPDGIKIYGIEPEKIYLHTGLSEPVKKGIERVKNIIFNNNIR